MATRQFTRSELLSAERLVAQVASENVPEGDFSQGTTLRDLAVRAISATVMYLRAENAEVVTRTDLRQIRDIADETERTAAIETFAANFFLTRGGGGRARGYVEVAFSSVSAGAIPVGTRFAAEALVFYLDASSPVPFAASSFRQRTNSATGVVEYILRLPVVALSNGASYNITARVFSSWDRFHGAITSVENLSTFSGGRAEETADELYDRMSDALTVRNLLTPRSINTVLPELFPDLETLLVVEAGDPEMQRDRVPLLVDGMEIHTGGATDIYGFTDVSETTVDLIVGASATDAAGVLDTFVDLDLFIRNVDWRGRVVEGDILRLYNSASDAGSLFQIVEVESFFVRVEPLLPFNEVSPKIQHGGTEYTAVGLTVGTRTLTFDSGQARFTSLDIGLKLHVYDGEKSYLFDVESLGGTVGVYAYEVVVEDPESLLATLITTTELVVRLYDVSVDYSIGNNAPNYNNAVSRRDTGQKTKEIRVPGSVILPNAPIYRIREVVALDATFTEADAVAGGVVFDTPVSVPPVDELEYQVVAVRPDHAQSLQASTRLRIGPEDSRSGTDGALSSVTATTATFTSASNEFSTFDLGSSILVTSAYSQVNLGLYVIEAWLSSTSVTVRKQTYDIDAVVLLAEADMAWRFERRGIYDGMTLRVSYETIRSFESIAAYVDAGDDRVVAASTLFRAPHPVYVGFHLQYQLKSTATGAVDADEAARFLGDYISTFPAFDILNVSDIVQAFRNAYTDVGNVKSPMAATYYLISPTGSRVYFVSNDEISLSESLASTPEDVAALQVAVQAGVSDRTVKVVSFSDLISVEQV